MVNNGNHFFTLTEECVNGCKLVPLNLFHPFFRVSAHIQSTHVNTRAQRVKYETMKERERERKQIEEFVYTAC